MNSRSSYGIFLLAIALIGCESPPDPSLGFPPLPKAEPLADAKPSSTPATPATRPSSSASIQPGPVDADAAEEFTTTASGLKYRIRRKSDGVKPTAASTVEVNYKGWFDDGKQFDSSFDRGKSVEFLLNRVVKGWTEGMQLVGEGGMIELEVPYELGYGETGRSGIPPKSTLHFLIELLKVK